MEREDLLPLINGCGGFSLLIVMARTSRAMADVERQ